jgi:hypothetical protein
LLCMRVMDVRRIEGVVKADLERGGSIAIYQLLVFFVKLVLAQT